MASNEMTIHSAIDAMTEDDVANWIAAGDYTSIGGVELPANVSQRVAEFAASSEVEGFTFLPPPAGPAGVPMPYPNTSIVGRKAGKGQQEYLKIKLTDVIITGLS